MVNGQVKIRRFTFRRECPSAELSFGTLIDTMNSPVCRIHPHYEEQALALAR